MSFARPEVLLGLLLLPALVYVYLADAGLRRRQAAAFADPRTAPSALAASPGWRRHAPIGLYFLAIVALVFALAKPQATIAVDSEQATVVLVTDRSGSMQAQDIEPNRLVAAQSAADKFLERLPRRVRAAAVAFNQRAEVIETPTTDRDALRAAFRTLVPRGGTATGDALDAALRLVRPRRDIPVSEQPPAAIILLSDGASVRGQDPRAVARQAAQLRVPIHTVALGTPTGTIQVPRPGAQGGFETRRVPPDVPSLRSISQTTGGRLYEARNAARLDAVYEELGSRVAKKDEKREVTAVMAGAAFLLIVGGGALSMSWFGRLP